MNQTKNESLALAVSVCQAFPPALLGGVMAGINDYALYFSSCSMNMLFIKRGVTSFIAADFTKK